MHDSSRPDNDKAMRLTYDRSLNVPYGENIALSPRISRVLAPNPSVFTFKGTGVYIVGNGASVAMIDPGPALEPHIEALKRALAGRTLSHILITHTHRDHYPATAPLKAWSGAQTYAAAPALHGNDAQNAIAKAHDRDFVPDHVLSDGDVIAGDGFTLQAVATPGHTADHMCFALREESALFCGDHVMGWSTSVIAPPDGDMGAYLSSLEMLIARDDAILYPTHGSPIPAPQDYLRALLAHRHTRHAHVLAALEHEAQTLEALTKKLYPMITPGLHLAARIQVLAHLILLEQQGQVTRDDVKYRLPT